MEEKKCPYCAETIKAEAIKCKHCGSVLGEEEFLSKVSRGFPVDKKYRRCLSCNFEGEMKTWLRNYSFPQLVAVICFLFYVIPGIVFIAWGWGKYKCPRCGALAKNVQLSTI